YLAFVTYPSSSNPASDIWLSKSTDGGASFGPASHVAAITLFDSTQFSGNGATDCGDGPFACPTGLTFSRFTTAPAVAADAMGVHVVWNGELPGGQSKVFVRNSPDGVSWPTVAGTLVSVWTDSRDLVPGTDPRETGPVDDHDGFDVYQPCTYVPNDINAVAYTSPTVADPCLSQGGLDQNIYAATG